MAIRAGRSPPRFLIDAGGVVDVRGGASQPGSETLAALAPAGDVRPPRCAGETSALNRWKTLFPASTRNVSRGNAGLILRSTENFADESPPSGSLRTPRRRGATFKVLCARRARSRPTADSLPGLIPASLTATRFSLLRETDGILH